MDPDMNLKPVFSRRGFLLLPLLGIAMALTQASEDSPSACHSSGLAARATGQTEDVIEKKLLEIAAAYRRYGRVDDETRWAPFLCRMPMPSLARFSKSDDDETHGQKLYYLFARDRQAYIDVQESHNKPGQVIVKESWHPVESERVYSPGDWEDWIKIASEINDERESNRDSDSSAPRNTISEMELVGSRYPLAERDGKVYRTEKLAGLYIMFRNDSREIESDDGWIYGTVSADGKRVTSSGLVQSCIACHQEAPHGRLFGIQ